VELKENRRAQEISIDRERKLLRKDFCGVLERQRRKKTSSKKHDGAVTDSGSSLSGCGKVWRGSKRRNPGACREFDQRNGEAVGESWRTVAACQGARRGEKKEVCSKRNRRRSMR